MSRIDGLLDDAAQTGSPPNTAVRSRLRVPRVPTLAAIAAVVLVVNAFIAIGGGGLNGAVSVDDQVAPTGDPVALLDIEVVGVDVARGVQQVLVLPIPQTESGLFGVETRLVLERDGLPPTIVTFAPGATIFPAQVEVAAVGGRNDYPWDSYQSQLRLSLDEGAGALPVEAEVDTSLSGWRIDAALSNTGTDTITLSATSERALGPVLVAALQFVAILAVGLLLAAAPLGIAGLGIICSVVGIFTVRAKEGANFAQLLKGLHKGVYIASFLIAVVAFGLLYLLLGDADGLPRPWWSIGLSILTGLIAGNVIAYATEYYTSYEHRPTQRIAEQALTGPATVIIAGIAEGMKSTWAALGTVVVAIILAYIFAGGADSFLMGLYGVGIAAVGMLSTLGITLATDAYGPIADNAGGNAEMTSQPPHVRERTDMLDSLGNTTAATGKGFAIGSAALTALALFAAFIQVVQVQIETQVENHAHANRDEYGSLVAPTSIYKGNGKFMLVLPPLEGEYLELDAAGEGEGTSDLHGSDRMLLSSGVVEAGIIDWSQSDPAALDLLEAGGVYGWSYDAQDGDMRSPGEKPARLTIRTAEGAVQVVRVPQARISDILEFYDVTLTNPRVLGGLFIGVLLTFLFCAMTMNAVGRAAYAMMNECRRQFAKMREGLRAEGMSEQQIADPMSWPKDRKIKNPDGREYPDYAECVAISTTGAQREMIVPSLLAITVPIAVGLVLSVPGVMGMLAGGLTSGFAVAIFMANAGGAWDNAKKLLESYGRITADDMVSNPEMAAKVPVAVRDQIHARAEEMIKAGRGGQCVYGKGSDDHKATVVGDTVGDPFKDTSGPSLNILIKLISIVSVVFAGLTVAYGPAIGALLGLD